MAVSPYLTALRQYSPTALAGSDASLIGYVGSPNLTGINTASTINGGSGGLFDGLTLKDKLMLGLGGLQTIGGLVGSIGSLDLANKQFNLQKEAYQTNLTNSVQAYNTALEDKARSRAVMEGQSDAEMQAYIAAHKATT